MTYKPKDCPIRHENGNCLVVGGFCLAVNVYMCEVVRNAYDSGRLSALREQETKGVEIDTVKPLTLAELREMDGQPVWCVDGCGHERWCLVSLNGDGTNAIDSKNGFWWGGFYCMDGAGNYGLCNVGWIAFRHKPKEV